MTEKIPSPFTLTPARILILVLGALALLMIVGTLMGGLSNYETLKETTSSAAGASSEP